MFLAQPNGQASSAAHNVKTPKQSNRKFEGVRQTRHTEPTEWPPRAANEWACCHLDSADRTRQARPCSLSKITAATRIAPRSRVSAPGTERTETSATSAFAMPRARVISRIGISSRSGF